MTLPGDDDWRLIEHAYRHSSETIAAIAKQFGVSQSAINRRRLSHAWPSRRAAAAKEPDVADRNEVRAELVARFYGLIKLKLEHMEEDMARSSERTPADNERETRALGTLIRNFEKVFGLEQETGSEARQGGGNDDAGARAEAEAIRRELAERLVRLRNASPHDRG